MAGPFVADKNQGEHAGGGGEKKAKTSCVNFLLSDLGLECLPGNVSYVECGVQNKRDGDTQMHRLQNTSYKILPRCVRHRRRKSRRGRRPTTVVSPAPRTYPHKRTTSPLCESAPKKAPASSISSGEATLISNFVPEVGFCSWRPSWADLCRRTVVVNPELARLAGFFNRSAPIPIDLEDALLGSAEVDSMHIAQCPTRFKHAVYG